MGMFNPHIRREMKTLKQQRGILDISGLESQQLSKDRLASSTATTLPISHEHSISFRRNIVMLKTFGVWFLLGAGLLFTSLFSIVAMRELVTGSKPDNFLLLLIVFVVAGGVFTGLLALAILRLVQPNVLGLGSVLRGEELMEYASRLGVSMKHLHDSNANLLEPELQHRVLEVERALRERRLYLVAIGAAVFSFFSAIAAWMVHLK